MTESVRNLVATGERIGHWMSSVTHCVVDLLQAQSYQIY
jgi:hypothetical protein